MLINNRYRQPDHIVIAAANGLHKLRRQSLNAVRAGLSEWLPASSVLRNLTFRKLYKSHFRTSDVHNLTRTGNNADACVYPMISYGELAQHSRGVFFIGRFAEHFLS